MSLTRFKKESLLGKQERLSNEGLKEEIEKVKKTTIPEKKVAKKTTK